MSVWLVVGSANGLVYSGGWDEVREEGEEVLRVERW